MACLEKVPLLSHSLFSCHLFSTVTAHIVRTTGNDEVEGLTGEVLRVAQSEQGPNIPTYVKAVLRKV